MPDDFEDVADFYNISVMFIIKFVKKSSTLLDLIYSDDVHYLYKVNGNIDYSKKIIANTVKLFKNSSADCYDIDLCLRKTFSLKLIKYKNEGE